MTYAKINSASPYTPAPNMLMMTTIIRHIVIHTALFTGYYSFPESSFKMRYGMNMRCTNGEYAPERNPIIRNQLAPPAKAIVARTFDAPDSNN